MIISVIPAILKRGHPSPANFKIKVIGNQCDCKHFEETAGRSSLKCFNVIFILVIFTEKKKTFETGKAEERYTRKVQQAK